MGVHMYRVTRRPDLFFVALNSLKYGEQSYFIAYFTGFTQNLVKIGLKLVLNSFFSLKLQNQRL